MATKEQNIARLKELAVILAREPEINGTAAEIAYRVAEWEEEAAVMAEAGHHDDGQTGNVVLDEPVPQNPRKTDGGELVRVRMLRTVHLCAMADQLDDEVLLAVKDRIVRIPAEKVEKLVQSNLVERV